MSITGKNSLSIRKTDVKESKTIANGFTKLVFAHKAAAGETGINLGSLITPTEMSALGFTNPSPTRLLEAKLFQFQDNLTLISSLRGVLIKNLSYRIASNSQIVFEGFTAQDGEIFTGVIDSNPISGIQVIDAKTPVSQGDLAIGATDFAIGFSTPTNREEILVYRNGLQQKRNTNNSSTVLDGSYYVVDNGSGYGSVIRFNTAPTSQPDYILVTAIGGVVESPTNSTFDEIEKVQGQIDKMVPTLAQLAGVPETDFQAAPNNVDLKQFGDIVNGLLDLKVYNKENTFGAEISSSGSIVRQSKDENGNNWIQSASLVSTGKYSITFVNGFFTEPPTSLVATVIDDTAGNRNISINSLTTSGCSVIITNGTSSSAVENRAFSLQVVRVGTDYKDPITLRQYLQSKGIL